MLLLAKGKQDAADHLRYERDNLQDVLEKERSQMREGVAPRNDTFDESKSNPNPHSDERSDVNGKTEIGRL